MAGGNTTLLPDECLYKALPSWRECLYLFPLLPLLLWPLVFPLLSYSFLSLSNSSGMSCRIYNVCEVGLKGLDPPPVCVTPRW
ncbi:hypothetical protein C0J52_22717 [Blattella germanica]|nr:hypothetical protein C0J52_22717 [Blattella germanica]